MILFCERQMGRCWHLNKPEGSSAAQRQSMCPGFNRQHCKHKQTSKLEKQNLSHSTSEENTGFTSWRGKRMLNGFHSFLDKTNLKAIWHKTSYGHYLAYEVMALLRKKKNSCQLLVLTERYNPQSPITKMQVLTVSPLLPTDKGLCNLMLVSRSARWVTNKIKGRRVINWLWCQGSRIKRGEESHSSHPGSFRWMDFLTIFSRFL